MPMDVWNLVASFFVQHDFLTKSRTCRLFLSITRQPIFWKVLRGCRTRYALQKTIEAARFHPQVIDMTSITFLNACEETRRLFHVIIKAPVERLIMSHDVADWVDMKRRYSSGHMIARIVSTLKPFPSPFGKNQPAVVSNCPEWMEYPNMPRAVCQVCQTKDYHFSCECMGTCPYQALCQKHSFNCICRMTVSSICLDEHINKFCAKRSSERRTRLPPLTL